jgi:predicted NBD/HSP70 family sugar kinase
MAEIQPPITIAQSEMRGINRSAVLEYLRQHKTASRTELARQLHFSKPTAMRIIDELLAGNLVRSAGQKGGGLGRTQELLTLNESENLVIGIDLGGSHISGGIANIGGEILFRTKKNQSWGSAADNLERVIAFIQELQIEASKYPGRLLGAALGVPGIIDSRENLVRLAPALDWRDFPLLEKLNSRIDLPLLVENDVNLAAMGEHWFGSGREVANLVMVAIGTGIGAGVILEGKLYRGFRESSGEIGYLLPGLQFLDRKYPSFGAFESLASGKGIADRGRQAWSNANGGKPAPRMDAEAIFKAARDHQPWAEDVINEAIDYLTLALANISVTYDPELIIIGGGVANAIADSLPAIHERLRGVIPFVPRIEVSQLLENACILGAVARVFQKTADYAVVQTV